jgi:hypothetical protein
MSGSASNLLPSRSRSAEGFKSVQEYRQAASKNPTHCCVPLANFSGVIYSGNAKCTCAIRIPDAALDPLPLVPLLKGPSM